MIQLNLPNVVTIALAGMLGYALVAGFPKAKALITSSMPNNSPASGG